MSISRSCSIFFPCDNFHINFLFLPKTTCFTLNLLSETHCLPLSPPPSKDVGIPAYSHSYKDSLLCLARSTHDSRSGRRRPGFFARCITTSQSLKPGQGNGICLYYSMAGAPIGRSGLLLQLLNRNPCTISGHARSQTRGTPTIVGLDILHGHHMLLLNNM